MWTLSIQYLSECADGQLAGGIPWAMSTFIFKKLILSFIGHKTLKTDLELKLFELVVSV